MIIPQRVLDRALDSIAMGPNGCHLSTYSIGSHGYSQVGWADDETGNMVATTVHRAIWVGTYGSESLPAGMVLDHVICQNRRCVNVAHLRLLTRVQNAARGQGRDWPLDECANKHKLAEHWRPASPARQKGYCVACRAEARIRKATPA